MLLEFTVGNFRSINQKCTISMRAQSIKDEPAANVVKLGSFNVLKTAAIYGANSSGKTNFIKALAAMRGVLVGSVKLNPGDSLDYDPFLLSSKSGEPSFLEVVFLLSGYKYRYGFELTKTEIVSEWLFRSKGDGVEHTLFVRNNEGIAIDEIKFAEGKDKEVNTNTNRLFLSLCGQLGGDISKSIVGWFILNLNAISGLEGDVFQAFSTRMLHEELNGCKDARQFFSDIKLGFIDLVTTEKEFDPSTIPNGIPAELREQISKNYAGKKTVKMESKHHIYDQTGDAVSEILFDIDKESDGTRKLIQFSGPIFDVLANGKVLLFDELDAKMHPLISLYIIKLFNNPKTNPHNAQLIFTTHDINLLSSKLLRRDQIWFTEKNRTEQTDLYCMMDIKLPDGSKPRNDANYEQNYIAGRYGAIPYIIND